MATVPLASRRALACFVGRAWAPRETFEGPARQLSSARPIGGACVASQSEQKRQRQQGKDAASPPRRVAAERDAVAVSHDLPIPSDVLEKRIERQRELPDVVQDDRARRAAKHCSQTCLSTRVKHTHLHRCDAPRSDSCEAAVGISVAAWPVRGRGCVELSNTTSRQAMPTARGKQRQHAARQGPAQVRTSIKHPDAAQQLARCVSPAIHHQLALRIGGRVPGARRRRHLRRAVAQARPPVQRWRGGAVQRAPQDGGAALLKAPALYSHTSGAASAPLGSTPPNTTAVPLSVSAAKEPTRGGGCEPNRAGFGAGANRGERLHDAPMRAHNARTKYSADVIGGRARQRAT